MIDQINNISMAWWGWMSQMFWQVGLLIIFVACIDILIKKWAWPQLRYTLWLLVLLKLVIPPSYSVPGSLTGSLRPMTARLVKSMTEKPDAPAEVYFNPYIVDTDIKAPSPVSVQPRASARPDVTEPVITGNAEPSAVIISDQGADFIWQSYAMAVWLLGMAVLGAWLALRLNSLRKDKSFKNARAVPESFEILMLRCSQRLGLNRLPHVVVTDKVVCPAVFGLLRPTLLVPKNYLKNLTHKDVEHMLLHELAHIKRGDTIVHGLYMILQIVYWFNPLLWLARRQLHHLRELCCDAAVARLLRSRTCEYRETIIDIARRYLTKPVEPGLGLLGLFEDSNRLLVRLNWLEKESWRYPKMKNLTVIIIVVLMLSFVLPMALAENEPSSHDRITDPAHSTTISHLSETTKHEATQSEQEKQEQLAKELQILDEQLKMLQDESRKLTEEQEAQNGSQLEAVEKARVQAEKMQKALALNQKKIELLEKLENVKMLHENTDLPDSAEFKQWRGQMQNWQNNAQMKQWQADMKLWQLKMNGWRLEMQRFAEAQRNAEAGADESHEMPAMPAMPEMPQMPPMPQIPHMPQMPEGAVVSIGSHDSPSVPVITHPVQVEIPAGGTNFLQPPADSIEINKDKDDKFTAAAEMDFSSKVKPDAKIIIKGTVGGVTLNPGKADECSVRAIIKAKADSEEKARKAAEQVGVNVRTSEEEVYLQPTKEDNDNWSDLSVDLIVTVPTGCRPEVSTNVGGIVLKGITGQITAKANVGSIKAAGTGSNVNLATNVGSINIVVSKNLSARLEAKTENGSIKSDLPLQVTKKNFISNEASAVFGEGKGKIVLYTNVGSIKISNSESDDATISHQVLQNVDSNNVQSTVSHLLSSVDMPGAKRKVKSIIEKPEGDRQAIERTETADLPMSGGSELDVENEDGTITLVGSDTDKCQVVSTFKVTAPTLEGARDFSKKVNLQMKPTDKGISIKVIRPEKTPSNYSASVDMKITVPRNTSLKLKNEDGNIQITNIEGGIKVASEDGDITCENIAASLELNVEDGNVKVKNARLTDCRVRMEDGNLECDGITGNFNVRHEDGNITINYVDDASDKYTVDIQGEDGQVKIKGGVFTNCTVKMESGMIDCQDVGGSFDFGMEEGKAVINYADDVPENCSVNVKLEEGSIQLSAPAEMFPEGAPAEAEKKDDGAEWKTKAGNRTVNLQVEEGSIKVDKR